MKLTQNSILLMDFFIKNNFINHEKNNKKTNLILYKLYNEIYNSYEKLLNFKKITLHYILLNLILKEN